jgi:hypothetical protein
MKIYKFRDSVDGNYAFILATDLESANKHLKKITSIHFTLSSYRDIEDIKKPIIIKNNILPF